MECQDESKKYEEPFNSVMELKALNKYTESLVSTLKNDEETAIANEMKLMKIKVAKWQLKSRVICLMSYFNSLNQLEKAHKEWETSAEIETKIGDMQSQYLDQKTNYAEICCKIEKLKAVVEEAERIYSQKCLVDKQLEEFHLKKQKYEELKSEFEKKSSLFNGNCNATEATKMIEEKKKQIEESTKQIENLEREMEVTQTTLNGSDLEVLKKLESFFSTEEQTITQQESQIGQKLQTHINICGTLSGMQVLLTNEECDHIKLYYGSEMDSSITVELRYSKQKPPHSTKLIDVKIEDCLVPVDDLISRAIADNNFPRVIPELQIRLENSQNFAKEIKKLRETAAIDWIPGKHILKLIVGNYVCTLSVSISQGQIKLMDVKGPKEREITDLQPIKDNPSITDWVNHLQTVLTYQED